MVDKLQQTPLTEQEKRAALAAVLASQTFARSAQMRLFLSYVCEREMAGELEDLTEYQIAVNVLGRRKDFNLTDDSSVRNRAYELRQRLEKFYLTEQQNSPLEIHIPRGGYVPNYLRSSSKPKLEAEFVAAAVGPPPAIALQLESTGKVRRNRGFWNAVCLVALSLGIGLWAGSYFGRPHPPGILKEAWGPLLTPGDELMITIATNLHLIVRQHVPAEDSFRFEAPPQAVELYGNVRRPLEPDLPLYMMPAQLSVPLAEVVAATTLCRVRQMFGGSCRLLPESESPIASLRGRSAVLIGSGTNSSAAALLLKRFPYTIDFAPDGHFAVLDQRKPQGQKVAYIVQPTGDPVASQHYGLLTVISSVDASGVVRRTLVLSGSASAGIQAATEFFSSPSQMALLQERFQKEGFSGFPANYQVLIKCQTSGVRLIAYEYLTHTVLRD